MISIGMPKITSYIIMEAPILHGFKLRVNHRSINLWCYFTCNSYLISVDYVIDYNIYIQYQLFSNKLYDWYMNYDKIKYNWRVFTVIPDIIYFMTKVQYLRILQVPNNYIGWVVTTEELGDLNLICIL